MSEKPTDEWQQLALGSLVDFQSGGTPSKDNPAFWNGSTPWVSAKDMKQLFLDDTEDHITTAATDDGAKVVSANTVLMLTRGMTLLNDVPICIVRRPMSFNQDVKALQPKGALDGRYLPYLLLGNKYRLLGMVDLAGHGTGRLNTEELKSLDVLLPPSVAQQAIASILGALDDKIELNRRRNGTLEAMARAIYKAWFVDFEPVRAKAAGRRPPGLNPELAALFPNAFQDSELGEIPKGWRVGKLNDICRIGRGSSPRPIHNYMGGTVPWIKIADATSAGGPFIYETKEFVTEAGSQKSVWVNPGDLILSNSATCGVPIFVGLRGCIHDGWLHFSQLRHISRGYLYHWLTTISEHLIHIADGSVQKNLNTGLVGGQQLTIPVPELVQAFDQFNDEAYRRIDKTVQESRTLAALRDSLLPKLISGELRVPDAERIIRRTTR